MSNVVQRAFNGGEISPSLYSRTDLTKYASGLRLCRNFMVQKHGGVTNRSGFRFVAECKTPTNLMKLVPFIYSANQVTQNYVLAFSNFALQFMQLGGQVITSGVAAYDGATAYKPGDLVTNGGLTYYCIAATTGNAPPNALYWYLQPQPLYEIPSPYAAADLALVKFIQSADVMTLVHPNYPVYELKRFSHTKWTLRPMSIGPGISTPTGLVLGGGNAGAITYYAVTAIDSTTGEESVAGIVNAINRVPSVPVPTTVAWNGVPNATSYNIYRSTDGVTFGYIGTYGGVTSTASKNVWVANTSTISTVVASVEVEPAAGARASMAVITAPSQKPADGNFTIMGRWKTTVTNNTRQASVARIKVYYSRDGEPFVDAGYIYTTYTSDTGIFHSFANTINVPDNGYSLLTLAIAPALTGVITGAPVGGDTWQMDLDFTAGPDNQITWVGLGAILFSDPLLAVDLLRRPPTSPVLFNAVGKYPSAVGRYQQRLLLAAPSTDPETTWASRIGVDQSFTKSFPIVGDDALSWTSAGRQVNEVRHLLDVGKLIVFTSGGEIVVEGNQDGVLLPDAINPRQVSYSGSAQLPPLIVVNTALFVQARGTIIRDLMSDGIEGYKGNDLTLMAAHLFEKYTLVDWTYQQIPHSIVWVVRSDGVLLGLTYVREQSVWGWHQHTTDGVFENVCVIPESNEDALYAVIRRTVNGVVRRYIERMDTRQILDIRKACFADAALSYDGTNTTATTMTLSGGVLWDDGELLTITSSAAAFNALDVGNEIVFTAADGRAVRFRLENYTSPTVMTGHALDTIPVELQNVATVVWGRAVDVVTGLGHLEGKYLSVLGDGSVVASPVDDVAPLLQVVGGSLTLPQPYVMITAGLPYYADMETLDIDSMSGSTVKDRRMLVNHLTAFIQESRGFMAGQSAPSDGIVAGLQEYQPRTETDDYNLPPLITDSLDIQIDVTWNKNGRIFIRQPYPLPLTVLSVAPSGYLTTSHSTRGS